MPNQKTASKFTPKLAHQKADPKAMKKGSKLVSLVKAALGGSKSAGKPAQAAPKTKGQTTAPVSKKPVPAPVAKAKPQAVPPQKGAKAAAVVAAPVPGKAGKVDAAVKGGAMQAKAGRGKAKVDPAAAAAQARASSVSAAMAKVKGTPAKAKAAREESADAVCREVACEGLATSGGYCRMHYIKNWKKIKRKELILKEGKLNQYIEELVAKYPDKYIEAIRQDLASDKDFAKVIYDLDLDESVDDFEVEGENVDQIIDTIKRDFDDEGEGF